MSTVVFTRPIPQMPDMKIKEQKVCEQEEHTEEDSVMNSYKLTGSDIATAAHIINQSGFRIEKPFETQIVGEDKKFVDVNMKEPVMKGSEIATEMLNEYLDKYRWGYQILMRYPVR